MFLFIFLLVFLATASAAPTLTSISTTYLKDNTLQYGSVVGFTKLYIKGTEFPASLTDAQVTIGPFPCSLIEILPTRILCFTGQANDSKTYNVSVYFYNTLVPCVAATPCQFTYLWEQTPLFYSLFPAATYAGNETRFWGIQKVSSVTSIVIKIGDFLCDYLNNSDNDNKIVDFWYNYVKCRISPLMPTGLYNTSMIVSDGFGASLNYPTLRKLSAKDTVYNMAIMPIIDGISSSRGSRKGQILTIRGRGFSANSGVTKVSLDHQLDCNVINVTAVSIVCELSEDVANLAANFKNMTTFVGGSGADYRKYKLNGESVTQMKLMKGFPDNYVFKDRYYELETPQNIDDIYGQKLEGFFRAPKNGTFRFYLAADTTAEFWLSRTPNNTNSSLLEKLCYLNYSSAWRNYYDYSSQISSNITMIKDNFYNFEAYQATAWSGDHLTVSVEVPSDTWKLNSIVQQQTLTVSAVQTRETIRMRIFNVAGGTFTFLLQTMSSTGVIDYSVTSRVLPWNADEFAIAQSFNTDFDYFNATVVRYCLTFTGVRKADFSLGCEGFEWEIVFNWYRTRNPLPVIDTKKLLIFTSGSIIGDSATVLLPNVPIRGTFALKFGANTTRELSYNALPSTVREEIKTLPGVSPFVEVTRKGNPDNGCEWTIIFNDMVGVTSVFIPLNYMKGGRALVTISSRVDRVANTNQLFEGVPFWMIHSKHVKPQIVAKIGEVYASCLNCSYEFIDDADMPFVDYFRVTSNGLEIYVNNTNERNSSEIIVKFAESVCFVSNISYDKITRRIWATCDISKNPDGSLMMVAGKQQPIVHFAGMGYLTCKNKANFSYFVNMSLIATQPNKGSLAGNQIITIFGSGFPLNLDSYNTNNNKNFFIYFGDPSLNSTCLLLSSNNTAVSCQSPVSGIASTVQISIVLNSFNFSINASYVYTVILTPTIQGFFPLSASPVLKSLLSIKGTGFDALTTVQLNDLNSGTKIYDCTIISRDASNVVCVLPGGKTGLYRLKVIVDGKGACDMKISDLFEYKILIKTVTPNIGSIYGGTLLTIIGDNFSPNSGQNQVVLATNFGGINCDLTFFNKTCLQCITRPGPQDSISYVTVFGRLIETAICLDNISNCSFNYFLNATPSIQVFNPNAIIASEDLLNLTGTLLDQMVISLNSINCDILNANSTFILFRIPDLPSGNYDLVARSDLRGYATSIINNIKIQINISIADIDQKIFYNLGGLIRILGSGFKNSSVLTIYLASNDGSLAICNIVGVTTTKLITCETGVLTRDNYRLNLKFDDTFYSCAACSITIKPFKILSGPYILDYTPSEIKFETSEELKIKVYNLTTCKKLEIFLSSDNPRTFNTISNFSLDNITIILNFSQGLSLSNNFYLVKILCFQTYISSYLTINNTNNFPSIFINYKPKIFPFSAICSYNGGTQIYMSSKGILSGLDLRICGFPSSILGFNSSHYLVETPKILVKSTISAYKLSSEPKVFLNSKVNWFSDNGIFPNLTGNFSYKSPNSTECFIGFDSGINTKIKLSKLALLIQDGFQDKYINARLEASNDSVLYNEVYHFDDFLLDGWYSIDLVDNISINEARFWRIKQENKSSQYSFCYFSDIRAYGTYYLANDIVDLTNTSCDITFYNASTKKFDKIMENIVFYQNQVSAYVDVLSPSFVIRKVKLDFSFNLSKNVPDVKMKIDNLDCLNLTLQTGTNYTCTVYDPNFSISSVPKVEVFSPTSGRIPLGTNQIKIFDKWSESSTWGGESPPREGDSVYIPFNQSIILDVSPPAINLLLIEGSLVALDSLDIVLQVSYFLIRNGSLSIGSNTNPFTHNFRLELIGNSANTNLPIFGRKVLGCFDCQIEIVGVSRNYNLAYLAKSSEINDKLVYLKTTGDLGTGDRILISGSGLNSNESEVREIKSVNSNNSFELNESLAYSHRINQDTDAPFVALLTRNIRIMGDFSSFYNNFGGTIHIYQSESSRLLVNLQNVELINMGQPMKSSITLRLIGSSKVLLQRVVIRNSFSRAITIIGGRRAQILESIIYKTLGHGLVLQTGAEMSNTIKGNIVIGCARSWSFDYTDLTPASYYLTNLNNIFEDNMAVEGDKYGVWVYLKNATESPFFLMKICPDGIALNSFKNTSVFSHEIGLFVYPGYWPREKPCESFRDNMNMNQPFMKNKPLNATFNGFRVYRNRDSGVFAQKVGAVKFDNFELVENRRAGFEIRIIETIDGWFSLRNSKFKGSLIDKTGDRIGLITAKSDGNYYENLSFINFDNTANSIAILTCSGCELDTDTDIPGGKIIPISGLSFVNVSIILSFKKNIPDIVLDKSGNLDGSGTQNYVFPYIKYLSSTNFCKTVNNSFIFCPSSDKIQIRVLTFCDLRPEYSFPSGTLTITRINESLMEDNSTFTNVALRNQILNEDGLFITHKVWTLPIITGLKYKILWQEGDFDQVTIILNKGFIDRDSSTKLYFSFSSQNQKFQITAKSNFDKTTDIAESSNLTDFFNSTTLGKFINSIQNKSVSLNIYNPDPLPSEKRLYISRLFCDPANSICSQFNLSSNATINNSNGSSNNSSGNSSSNGNSSNSTSNNTSNNSDNGSVTPIPINNNTDRLRLWSEPDSWKTRKVPTQGSDINIPSDLRILLDIDPPNLGVLTIDGELYIDVTRPITVLKAMNIFVRGKLIAGNETNPVTNKLLIVLLGNKTSTSVNFAGFLPAANKAIIVSGQLILNAVTANTLFTRLITSVMQNNQSIYVSTCQGWASGDLLAISATENPIEFEQVTIDSISDNCKISLKSPIKYNHYGAARGDNYVDMRARVALISRKIEIRTDNYEDNWGCRIIVFRNPGNFDPYLLLQGVLLRFSGQIWSNFGALGLEYAINNGLFAMKVANSCITDSFSHCVKLVTSKNIEFTNNLLFNCSDSGFSFEGVNSLVKIQQNIVFGIRTSFPEFASSDLLITRYRIAGLIMRKVVNFVNSIEISNNFFSGSPGFGVAIPATDCGNSQLFQNNEISSNYIGLYIARNYSDCIELSYNIFYRNHLGLISYPEEVKTFSLKTSDFIENGLAISVNLANSDENIQTTLTFSGLRVIGVLRITGFNSSCSGLAGIRMAQSTKYGKELLIEDLNELPIYKPMTTNRNFQKFLINNSSFINFQLRYQDSYTNCQGNTIFSSNDYIFDRTSTIFTDSLLKINTSLSSIVIFSPLLQTLICGTLSCSGENTKLIKDATGTFFNKKSSIISKNLNFSDCQSFDSFLQCDYNFNVLTIESLNSSENANRVFQPIFLTNNRTNLSNELHCFKNFDYSSVTTIDNTICLNRFTGIIQPFPEVHKLSFSNKPPQKTRISLEPSDPIILAQVLVDYGASVSVRVLSNQGTVIKPSLNIDSSKDCGGNTFSSDGKLQVRVNSISSCIVILEVVDSISLSIGFDMTEEEFYTNDGSTLFIDRVALLLSISTDRLRIAGIRKGSVYVDFYIDEAGDDLMALGQNFVKNVQQNQLNFMNKTVISLEYSIVNSKQNIGTTGTIINNQTKTKIDVNCEDCNNKNGNNNSTIIIVVITLVVFLTICWVLGVVLWKKYKKKKVKNLETQDSNQSDLIEKRHKGEFIFDMKTFQTKGTDFEIESVETKTKECEETY